ncbi:MAG: nitroreductase family protein [Methanolobus sp.]|nr:nitroreductase family protein [Methanolobus sp.]
MKTISFEPDICTHCGICIQICPAGLIASDSEGMPFMPDEAGDFCSKCGNCEAFCPEGAISPQFNTTHSAVSEENMSGITPGQMGIYMRQRRSIRNYKSKMVDRETIEEILDIVRYSPSGMNNQPVHWLIIHDPDEVGKLSGLTIDWMRSIRDSEEMHPLKPMVPALIAAYEAGKDPICRGAPHVAIAYAAEANPMAFTDSIIALSWFELAAPAFDLGTCWAGFLKLAASEYGPLIEELGLPEGHVVQYAMMFGYPKYKIQNIPGREPARITWK